MLRPYAPQSNGKVERFFRTIDDECLHVRPLFTFAARSRAVDDFWGTAAWEQWSGEMSRGASVGQYPITDVPLDDPILRSLFVVAKVPQITNIQFWRRYDGRITSERGEDSAEPHLRAIRDDRGRIMVLMTHNTDVADSWEREGEDPGFFLQFSPSGYALGIDVLLHAMSH